MGEERVRLCDLAEELGVSTATVSNVIHGKTAKISEETVKRVMALVEERQYIPNMAGILLAQNSSKILGVFIHDHEKYEGHALEDPFLSSALDTLSTEMEASGRFMMVKKTKRVEDIIRFSSMWNMEGVIVIGFCQQDYTYLRQHSRIPFVVYDGVCDQTEGIVNLTIDNFSGGYQVGEHFRCLGHRRAICLSDNEAGVDRERYLGFREGFSPGEARLLRVPMAKTERRMFYRHHWEELCRVTAVFAVSDHYAVDFMCFLREKGRSVPEEISVAGFDDIPLCQMVYPPVTTVRQDLTQRAELALKKLEELRGRKGGGEIKLPVKLVVRQSTGPVPVSERE